MAKFCSLNPVRSDTLLNGVNKVSLQNLDKIGMCGISGIYHFKNSRSTDENTVIKMRDTLMHRGPDSAGTYISKNKKVGLGHRRLAIIDLSPAGHQPMANEDKTVWIVFNGEIYNFQEIRRELEKKHRFQSKSDTEVIIHAYEEYGPDCVKKFNGMFSFVVWDEKKELLFAARDHLGIKPFYYAIQNGNFYFGSEIKAILAHPDFKKELNENSVSNYLTFSSVPAPHTLFKDVKKLPPAHYLVIDKNGQIQEKEYWSPITISNRPESEEFYIDEVRRILRDSIKSQMVSDVPFGCFLSGGIDSSINAALMTEALGKPVEAFSVGSRFEKYNEFQYSRQMAKFLKAKNHEAVIDENDLEEFLTKIPYHLDDLNGDYVCLPLFYLSKLTRQNGVIVVQIGEGSDEIFAGYKTYLAAAKLYENWWSRLEKMPQFMKTVLWQVAKAAPSQKLDFHKEYIRRLAFGQKPFWGMAVAFSDYQKEQLLTEDFKKTSPLSLSYSTVEKYYNEAKEKSGEMDFLKLITYIDIKHRLPELLLMRADKITMAHSIEGRVPFLDHRLVELAFSIPSGIKTKNNEPKYVLKKAVEGIIPSDIIWRPKQGFSTPMNEWLELNSPIAKNVFNSVFNSRLKERNILNYDYVESFIKSNQHKDNAHIFRLWNLITLSLWYDYWFT